MATGLFVALTVLSLTGAGVVGMTMAAPHATMGGMQGGCNGGMMNGGCNGGGMMGGGCGGGMMGGGGSCPYQNNYQYCQQHMPYCQQYMEQHNITNGQCPRMG